MVYGELNCSSACMRRTPWKKEIYELLGKLWLEGYYRNVRLYAHEGQKRKLHMVHDEVYCSLCLKDSGVCSACGQFYFEDEDHYSRYPRCEPP